MEELPDETVFKAEFIEAFVGETEATWRLRKKFFYFINHAVFETFIETTLDALREFVWFDRNADENRFILGDFAGDGRN